MASFLGQALVQQIFHGNNCSTSNLTQLHVEPKRQGELRFCFKCFNFHKTDNFKQTRKIIVLRKLFKLLTMKQIMILLFFATVSIAETHAQDSAKTIKSVLDAKRYSFIPTSMTPSAGRTRQINSGFSFDVKGDTLQIYLPYIGKAYSAPMNPSDAGYDFTSTSYDYAVKEGKKDRYNVTIKTKDKFTGSTFYFTVFDNGTASLQANSNDKQAISYNGYIKAKK
jgi:hypothetical protein